MSIVTKIRERFRRRPTVAVIRLYGTIGAPGRFGGSLSDQALAEVIERAFSSKPRAVALAINSPGGSPAQSSLIAGRIRRLADEKKVPVIAFCEDVAASGGYWLACAADEIYADENSILGSIGVIYAGFGFQELIARHGVERRVHTAGEDKSLLDPFRPEREEDVERLHRLQRRIHDNFKAQVRKARDGKLKESESLFSGDIWVGAGAVETGLADGVGHLAPMMRERFGPRVRFRVHGPRKSLLRRLGAPSAAEIAGAIEEQALWARFGV